MVPIQSLQEITIKRIHLSDNPRHIIRRIVVLSLESVHHIFHKATIKHKWKLLQSLKEIETKTKKENTVEK